MQVDLVGNTQISTSQYIFGSSSIYMDGSGDYIDVTDNGNLDFGTGDFTIEWWQRLPTLTNNYNAVDLRNGSNGAKILLYSNPTDKYILYVNSATAIDSGSVLTANTWQHIALSRSSGSTRLFVDGTQRGSTYSDSNNYSHDEILIFYNSNSSAYDGEGYMDEFRVSNSARYSSNFTVPNSRFTADANTMLLIHGDGTNGSTNITDDPPPPARSSAAVRYVDLGGTSVSSTGGKFGGAAYGSGDSGDYIRTNPSGNWSLDSDQVWTIEFFFKTSSGQTPSGVYTLGGLNYGNTSGIRFYAPSGSSQLRVNMGGSSNNYSFNYSTSYQHLAFVNDGSGTLKFYLDGTLQLTKTGYSYNMSSPTDKDFYYGSTAGQAGQPTYYFDELRISRVQRYTSNFTPTSTAFTNDNDTVALFHFDNSYTDDNS